MRALVVYCHPLAGSLCATARDRVLASLSAAGHDVRLIDLYAEEFDPVLSREEKIHHVSPPDGKSAVLRRHAADLRWCEAVVFVYPTWWSGQPAMLTGWLDRALLHGVTWELPPGKNRIRPLLHNIRRIVVVTTHGSTKTVNALQGEAGKRVLFRSFRALCHPLATTSWIALYDVDNATDEGVQEFLDAAETRMLRLHRRR